MMYEFSSTATQNSPICRAGKTLGDVSDGYPVQQGISIRRVILQTQHVRTDGTEVLLQLRKNSANVAS